MFRKIVLFFVICVFSISAFSQEKVEDLPREKSKALGKWEVVPTLTSKEEKKPDRKRGIKAFSKRVRNKNKPLLNLEKDDEAIVVYNPRRKSTGTVNGTLIVNLNDVNDERDILRDYPVKKLRLEKKIKFGFYKVRAGNDIEQVVENLKKDPRIKSVEVEVKSSTGGIKPL